MSTKNKSFEEPKMDQEQLAEVQKHFRKLFESFSETAAGEIFQNIGSGGRLADSLGISAEALEITYCLAMRYYNKGLYKKALTEFLRLSMFDPYDSRFFVGVGHCYLMLKDLDYAYRYYCYAVAHTPDDVRAHFYAAQALIQTNYEKRIEWSQNLYKTTLSLIEKQGNDPVFADIKKIVEAKLIFLERIQKNKK